MSAWLEIHQSLPSHRKTFAVCDLLELEPYQVVGHLACFWMWALDNAPTGRLDGVGNRVIAIAANWKGDAATFTEALVTARFLDRDDQGLAVHNWDLYAGKLLEHRRTERERLREHRANVKRTSSERATNVPITKEERTPNVQESYDVHTVCVDGTGPNRTGPYTTQPKNALQPAAAVTYLGLTQRLKAEANKPVVIADGIRAWYEIDCQDFGRLGSLGKAHGYGEILKIAWDLLPSWNGVDEPLDYITATANGRKSDRKNGKNGHSNGHLPEKLPTNHQPAELPDVIDWEALGGALPNAEEEESAEDRRVVREHEYRLRADSAYGLWWEDVAPLVEQGKPFRPAPPWPAFLPRPDWMAEPVGMK